jgi:hypothetical protein
MSFLTDIAGIGGIGDKVIDAVEKYFPPDVSPEQKAQLSLAIKNIELDQQRLMDAAIASAENAINDRIASYEGTASDLKSVPVLGPFMLFLRGGQRVLIGYGTVAMDYYVFSGAWKLPEGPLTNCFWLINALVLVFLFGERAVLNVAPLLTQLMKKGA